MGTCTICGKDTKDSAVIYQAEWIDSTASQSENMFSKTTTTVHRYKNVAECTFFCCKDCRKAEKGTALGALILLVLCAGITALCFWGGPWFNNLPYPRTTFWQVIELVCVFGSILGMVGTTILLITLVVLVVHPYGNIENVLLKHLNSPQNSRGRVYMTKSKGKSLRRV